MQLDIFEEESEPHNIMLCTSTLLEGVNTSTENIIITKPILAMAFILSKLMNFKKPRRRRLMD